MKHDERIARVNALVVSIGSTGRRFMYHNGRYARFSRDPRGRVWYHDAYSQRAIYTHYRGRWRGFTEGGTIKDVVVLLRDYIVSGDQLHPLVFGPWQAHYCDGDLWGYGAAQDCVRKAAEILGITDPKRIARDWRTRQC